MLRKSSVVFILSVFVLSLIYAVTRYVLLGPIPAEQIPLFIMNKAISLSGIILVVMAFVQKGDRAVKAKLGETGFLFTIVHILISILLINETYFEKFFNAGEYNLKGGLSFLFGATAFALLMLIRRLFASDLYAVFTPKSRFYIKFFMLFFIAAHVAVMGWSGWFKPGDWYGYFPPITLLSFLVATFGMYKVGVRYYQK